MFLLFFQTPRSYAKMSIRCGVQSTRFTYFSNTVDKYTNFNSIETRRIAHYGHVRTLHRKELFLQVQEVRYHPPVHPMRKTRDYMDVSPARVSMIYSDGGCLCSGVKESEIYCMSLNRRRCVPQSLGFGKMMI